MCRCRTVLAVTATLNSIREWEEQKSVRPEKKGKKKRRQTERAISGADDRTTIESGWMAVGEEHRGIGGLVCHRFCLLSL